MPPEKLPKSGVKQVRGAVVRSDAIPELNIDDEVNGVADRNLAQCDFRLMRVQPAERLASVENVSGQTFIGRYGPCIAHLATAFAIERRLISDDDDLFRSEEHTSELQSLMRISYAVFCLKKKKKKKKAQHTITQDNYKK